MSMQASRSRALGPPLAVAALAALAVAFAGGALTDIDRWYQSLAKPSWQPPSWLFAPAWTVIFALTAVAAALAWRDAGAGQRKTLLLLFAVNAALNIGWSFLFFYMHCPMCALVEVAFLWLSILALILATRRISAAPPLLLLPYLFWVSFASFLNFTIVRLNGGL